MKTFWDIDINNKIAILKDDKDKLKLKFDIDIIDNKYINVVKREILEDTVTSNFLKDEDYSPEKLALKFAKLMRYLGDELNLLYLTNTLEFKEDYDSNGYGLFPIEDNIYIRTNGNIALLKSDEFIYTDYQSSLYKINKDTKINLIKLTIYNITYITHQGCDINIENETINGIDYYHLNELSLDEYDLDDLNINEEDIKNIENRKYEIILLGNSKIYIDYNSEDITKKDIKNKEEEDLLNILYEVFFLNKAEHITFNELKEILKSNYY